MNIENKVAADEIRGYQMLKADFQIAAEKLDMFDKLVSALDRCADRLADHTSMHDCVEFFELVEKAMELQK